MLAPSINMQGMLDSLDGRLRVVLKRYQGAGKAVQPRLLSITLATPELAGLLLPVLSREMVYWARLEQQHIRVAVGRCFVTEAAGQQRFTQLDDTFQHQREDWLQEDPDHTGLKAQAFTGFSFDPDESPQGYWNEFANACLFVPSVLYERKGSVCGLTFSCRWEGDSFDFNAARRRWLQQAHHLISGVTGLPEQGSAVGEPPVRVNGTRSNDHWLSRAQQALDTIGRGSLDKIVLTRSVRVKSGRPLDPTNLLARLLSQPASGLLFACAARKTALLGVSPERLVVLNNRTVLCDAVAGTIQRHGNLSANTLLTDQKIRHEQQLVVEGILRAIQPLCSSLQAPVEPEILASRNVQHLWSTIRGRVHSQVSLLQLASRLHPTPAVAGEPTDKVLDWLKCQGEQARGWYTGALGWLGLDGDGELSVVLRCAVLRANKAELYAGAGIVKGSDPCAELAETEWKLKVMLDSLAVRT